MTKRTRLLPVQEGLPETVRVGAHRFQILFVTETSHKFMSGLNGLCDFDEGRIYINRAHARRHSKDRVLTTILHEIGHAINHVYGVRDNSDEEGFVTGFSVGFVALLVDNPALLPWITKIVDETRSHHKTAK